MDDSRASNRERVPPRGHGWWPYLLPYVAFLLLSEIGARLPAAWSPALLVVKPALPAALMIYYARRGGYPELTGFRWRDVRVGLDVVVGVALAAAWMAPFIVWPSLRPDLAGAFDPHQLGEGNQALLLGLRLVGFAAVTPFFEELFIRSFVMRYADAYDRAVDFRDLPMARYTARSFWITSLVFCMAHVPWEWWVAIPWIMITNAWFYHRRHLLSVIVVHATTNAAILLAVAAGSGLFDDGRGQPLPLWFFL